MMGGLAVEFDHGSNLIVLQRACQAGVNVSLPLQPKQVPVVGPDSEEEVDPGVPFEHGLSVQAHGKVPPKMWVAHQAKGTLPKPKGRMVPEMAPMPGALLAKQPPMGTTSMQSPMMGATSTTSPTVGTTSRPTPIVGTASRPSSSSETVPGVTSKAVAPKQPMTGGWRHQEGLRPPVQQEMQEPSGSQTLAYMLRFTGELRADRGQMANATPDLGLRPVVRPKGQPVRPVQPPATVEIRDEDGADRISITSRSSSSGT